MESSTQLDAKTKEVWAGVRSTSTQRSSLQDYINELRARVSGIEDYQTFLDQSSVDDFDSYESGLQGRTDNRLVDSDDVSDARETLESNFASFSDYAGDSGNSTGVFGLSDFDGHRDYQTSNGVDAVAADVVNQTLKRLFTPGDVFISAVVNDLGSFSDLQTWLENRGFSSDTASDFVDELKAEFADWSSFESFVSGIDSIERLLDRSPHREASVPGVEYDDEDGILYLRYENELRMQQRTVDSRDDTGEPPNIDLQNLTISNNNPPIGLSVEVTCDAVNQSSSEDGELATTLTVDGRVRDYTTVEVPAGETRTVRFVTLFAEPGTYQVRIGDTSAQTVNVGSNTTF